MRLLAPGQQITLSGRRMLVVRVETIDGITHVWVRRQTADLKAAA